MTDVRSKRRFLPLIFILKSFKKPSLIDITPGNHSFARQHQNETDFKLCKVPAFF